MSHDPSIADTVAHAALDAPGAKALEVAPGPEVVLSAATPEQVKAADQVFAERAQESHTVAGVLGLWTGVLLLHDLAIEHFEDRDSEEEEEEPGEPEPDDAA